MKKRQPSSQTQIALIFLFFQKRATVRTQDYFYHPISNTPFSLGIALPRDHGKYRVKGEIEVSLAKFNSKYKNPFIDFFSRLEIRKNIPIIIEFLLKFV